MSNQSVGSKFHFSPKSPKKLILIVAIIALAVAAILTVAFLVTPNNSSIAQLVSKTTLLFPTNQTVLVNDNETTGIIVEITGKTLSNSSYFNVTTTDEGNRVPAGVKAPATEGITVIDYYDVKVSTNMTLTPDIIAKITITNSKFQQESIIYYWIAADDQWVSVSTGFQPPQTLFATFEAIDLTGTPIGVGTGGSSNESPSPAATVTPPSSPASSPAQTPSSTASPEPSSSPTSTASPTPTASPLAAPTSSPTSTSPTSSAPSSPPLVAPEYTLGALLALLACFMALALSKMLNKTGQNDLHFRPTKGAKTASKDLPQLKKKFKMIYVT